MSSLLCLPNELLHHVLSRLSTADDLANVTSTARALHNLVKNDDALWKLALERDIHFPLIAPIRSRSFRMMYLRHKPHWFLTRPAFWYSDEQPSRLMYSSYNDRTDTIEAHIVNFDQFSGRISTNLLFVLRAYDGPLTRSEQVLRIDGEASNSIMMISSGHRPHLTEVVSPKHGRADVSTCEPSRGSTISQHEFFLRVIDPRHPRLQRWFALPMMSPTGLVGVGGRHLWMLRSFDTTGWGGNDDQWLHSMSNDQPAVPSAARSCQDLLEQYRGPYAHHQTGTDVSSDSVVYGQLIRRSTIFYKFVQEMPEPFFMLPDTPENKAVASLDGYVARPRGLFLPANITTYEAIQVRRTNPGSLQLVRTSPGYPARLYGTLKKLDIDHLLKTMRSGDIFLA